MDTPGKKEMEEYPSEEASSQAESFDANKSGTSETYDMKDFCPGIRIEAKDFDGKWYPAKVSDVDWTENEILVHFENWNTKFDEWIPMDSSRLRPIQKQVLPSVGKTSSLLNFRKDIVKFSKGEEVMAMWSPYQKYPATIQAVLANDRYDVLFYDGFLKRLKSHKISKLEGDTVKSEVKNFTDIGTKEERRERKRKINVAELFHVNKRAKKKGLVHSKSQDIKTYPVSKSRNKNSTLKKPVMDEEIKEAIPSAEPNDTKPVEEKVLPTGIVQPTKALIDTIPAAFEVKYINGQTEMWSKQLYQRSEGRTAGKLDIVILNAQGRKFRSRNEIMKYCEENGIVYSHEAFDFSAKGRPKSKSVMQNSPAKPESSLDEKDKSCLGSLKKAPKKPLQEIKGEPQGLQKEVPVQGDLELQEPVEQNKVFIGDFEVVIENGKFICPVKTCSKHFRRENLLHMHMKHYHPEFSKYLDYTPSVTDLAYARTVGSLDAVESPTPAPRKMAATEKTEKSSIKTDSTRKISETSDPTKETKKFKMVDNKTLTAKVVPDATPTVAVAEEPKEEDPQKNKVGISSLQLGKNILNINENVPTTQESKGNSSDSVPIEKTNLNSEPIPPSLNEVKPVRPHRLQSRRKTGRFQLSGVDHVRKKRLMSQGHSRSHNRVRRQQQLEQLQPSQPNQTVISPCVEDTTTSSTLSQPFSVARYPKPHQSAPNDISDQAEVTEDSKSPLAVETDKVEKLRRNEIINCVCGIMEEDGLMIQCDICLCWQHGHCAGILRELDVPDKYICTICKNPYRARISMKYLHDQEWLKEGTLPSLSFRSKRDDIINQRKTILKRSHDLSGSIALLAQVVHSLRIKVNIAEKKDHPKLWLWAKKWTEKKSNRLKEEFEIKEERPEVSNTDLGSGNKTEEVVIKDEKQLPKAPEPEAPIDSAECRLNLLDHLIHYQTLIDARLSCIESLVAELESMQDDAVNDETPERYPRTKATVQMLLRDLNTMKKIAAL